MKKSLYLVIGVALVVAAALMWNSSRQPDSGSTTPAEKPTIKIGVVIPLTGDIAFMGEGIRDAVLMAKESLGDTKYNYDVIFEDDQMDAKMSASAANKLISLDKANALISFSSGTGNVLSPIAEQSQIVHMSIASDPAVAKGVYNFIHWTTPAEENRVFVEELQRRGIKRLGIIEGNTQGAAAVIGDLRERLKGTDIAIVTDQVFNMGEKDFRSLIAKAKPSNPDIYLLMAFSPELEILAKQIREAGITTPFTAIEQFELTEQRALFEDQWYVNAADPSQDFSDRFRQRTGKEPTLGAANAYDIFNLIVAASEKSDAGAVPTNQQIADQLTQIKNFNGVLGNLNVDAEGVVNSKAAVRVIKDGKPVTISQ